MNSATRRTKVALTGNVALELIAAYMRDAGYDVMPQDAALDAWRPDVVFDVTAHDDVLMREVAGYRDERFAALAGVPYARAGMAAIVAELGWQCAAAPKKILAVDADNTLWRGVVSEDGPAGVVPYAAFQQGLRDLRDAGVVLVMLSKNDADDVAKAPVDHALFALEKVNWSPKAGNLIAACRELNLGVESAVFVDDNPNERAQMKAHLPAVAVPPFPEDMTHPEQFLRRLREYFFADIGQTEEDRLRAHDYQSQARTLAATYATHGDYLNDLGLTVRPACAQEGDLPRLAQMAGKTNQFNATMLRRTREDFAALLADPTKRVYVFRAADRFGEQGLVLYVVVDLVARRLTDFVMSCRAMGRTLEHFALAYVERELGYRPQIDFIPTPKNRPFAAFLAAASDACKTYYKEIR